MTKAAICRNWQGFEPVIESRWNITQEEQRSKAIDYMNQVEPDLVIVNLPPHPWEQASHRINRRTWPRRRKLLALREQQRQGFLKTTHEISKWCQQSGCICVGIGEARSDLWREPMIQDMFDAARVEYHDMIVAAPKDMCTQLHGQEPKTKEFCMKLVKAAEELLDRQNRTKPSSRGTYAADQEETVPEERFTNPDAECPPVEPKAKPGFQEEMEEISQTVKDTVIMAHNRMGHPSRKTFLRMLRIGGSHPEAIKFAKNWTCPVCAEKLAPKKTCKCGRACKTLWIQQNRPHRPQVHG